MFNTFHSNPDPNISWIHHLCHHSPRLAFRLSSETPSRFRIVFDYPFSPKQPTSNPLGQVILMGTVPLLIQFQMGTYVKPEHRWINPMPYLTEKIMLYKFRTTTKWFLSSLQNKSLLPLYTSLLILMTSETTFMMPWSESENQISSHYVRNMESVKIKMDFSSPDQERCRYLKIKISGWK